MINLNIYYTKSDNHLETEIVSKETSTFNIDHARSIVISHMKNNYPDVKYKLSLVTDYQNNTNINIYLEQEISIKREYLLKRLFDGN